MHSALITLILALSVSGRPMRRATAADLKSGQDAIALNNKFKTLTATSACTTGENACVGGKFAQCSNGKFITQACGAGTICGALPISGGSPLVQCTTAADLQSRLAATGATGAAAANNGAAAGNAAANAGAANSTAAAGAANTAAGKGVDNAAAGAANNATAGAANNAAAAGASSADPQTSTTLDPKVIASGFASDGNAVPEAGQVASLTSTNNFINFCLTVPQFPITNGDQIVTGSCNPAPMGVLPATSAMPSSKFVFPPNGGSVEENTAFTIQMAISNLETGNFVNAAESYFAAPQQLNSAGQIKGHSHVVIEQLSSLGQTTTTNPNVFAFFKGLNGAAVNGVLTASVDKGLPAGAYKLSSINSAANHQPVLVPIAQHGSLDDAVYFTVTAKGAAPAAAANNTAAAGTAGAAGAAGAGGAAANGAAASASAAGAAGAKGGATGAASAKGAATSAQAAKGAAATAKSGTAKPSSNNAASNTAANKGAANKGAQTKGTQTANSKKGGN